ncbi:hypothetical protein GE21DRAFT_2582 [Neurospora crassa]|uniref:Uncharacterized protein n=3 Tax=Neurospora TaxID=5140 RepID=Q7SDG0_NEUCR|nr:hypothetical protein NCU08602 [Neurospora crassa OR74A]EAA34798.1 hypothetical protein NCU08602 [Neurospora crassa OR74A]KAK3495966.1 hypothetical protein B0T13DRAFT_512848 [Neurospora crassa]KAK3498056.1 hypothetical protein B0T23DRAFT_100147 [Neurospora hispaniola]KHE78774.1 hypothetical protein GE21DRAFT_2582 [Neurospora crassa]|eukprot:XP_964034.1 hypothetical protein NCU08602 [Neurospora crassa OR74A]
MKPLVGAMQAWSCTVISAFAMLILGVLCILFNNNHPELVGGTEDPEDGKEVAATAGMAIAIYALFFCFCGLQGLLHLREGRRGAIAL